MNIENIKSLSQITEIEISYRNKVKAADRLPVRESKEAYEIIMASWDMNKIDLYEQFKVLLLDRGNRCLGISEVSSGGITGVVADPRIIFATALKARAVNIILAHNHPSGNLALCPIDKDLTLKFKEAAKLLDMKVLDHLIVTSNGYMSYADEGLIL